MKNPILYILAICLLAACGGEENTDEMLVKKRAERDSLKTLHGDIGEQLAELETWITKNDPDLQRNLPVVTTFPLDRSRFEHFFEAHGTAEAKKNAVIYPNAPGNVRKILVQEGQRVSKGQKLIDLDSDVIAMQMKEVEANYELAKTTYERQKSLWDKKIGSELQYLQAKSQKEALEATMQTLREQERMQQIRAPFGGQVDEIFLNLGEMANPQMPIVRMVDLGEMHLEADVSESHITSTMVGDPVEVSFESLGIKFGSEIGYKSQFINPGNRSFKIWVQIPEGQPKILPNALGKVKVRDLTQDSVLVVPTRLIQEDSEGRSFVYKMVVDDEELTRAQKVFVSALSSYKGNSLLDENAELSGDVQLIDEGARLVVDGQEVREQEEQVSGKQAMK